MRNTPTLSIELVSEPCPFCNSDKVVVLRTEGINDDVLVNYCRTCEHEWPERVELPTVH